MRIAPFLSSGGTHAEVVVMKFLTFVGILALAVTAPIGAGAWTVDSLTASSVPCRQFNALPVLQ
jgi:hypothetical protein